MTFSLIMLNPKIPLFNQTEILVFVAVYLLIQLGLNRKHMQDFKVVSEQVRQTKCSKPRFAETTS